MAEKVPKPSEVAELLPGEVADPKAVAVAKLQAVVGRPLPDVAAEDVGLEEPEEVAAAEDV